MIVKSKQLLLFLLLFLFISSGILLGIAIKSEFAIQLNTTSKAWFFGVFIFQWIALMLALVLFLFNKYRSVKAAHSSISAYLNNQHTNEDEFYKVFNAVNDGIVILNLNGELIAFNDAILRALGFTRHQVHHSADAKQYFFKLFPDLIEKINEVRQTGEVLFDVDFVNINGNEMALEIRANNITFKGEDAVIAVGRNTIQKKISQQNEFNATIAAEERERSRVAKELHDSISPLLSTVKLYAQTLSDCDSVQTQQSIIHRIEGTINESIQAISEISTNLSPHILENFGFVEALSSYIDNLLKTKKIWIEFKFNRQERYSSDIEIVCYRVCTELINNTLKHACATQIYIELLSSKEFIEINYSDNGVGFNAQAVLKKNKGMGLYNIINRIKSIKGQIHFTKKTDSGMKTQIKIPL